tara:strand:+ start:5359 stop:6180 length:822 start_codon:yes stop_codon:yes gene_type:complete
MLSKRIIPCLDVTNGRVVKGTQFLELRDAGDAIELARYYNDHGADELVFLDITASSDKRDILKDLVQKVAKQIFIPFTVGGGIKSIEEIAVLLQFGADKVSINTASIYTPTLIKEASTKYGSQCIVVAIDAKRINTDLRSDIQLDPKLSHIPNSVLLDESSIWEIYTHGGRYPTGIDAVKWAVYMDTLGAGELLITSMDQDGTKAGYDIDLTHAISSQVAIPCIASGGAGTTRHIADVLQVCDAALLASLLHYKELTVEEIKQYCLRLDLPIR